MPKPIFPRDRFDELPEDTGRAGAHRAENPRMRGGAVAFWAAVVTIALVMAGIVVALAIREVTADSVNAGSAPVGKPAIDASATVEPVGAARSPAPQPELPRRVSGV